MRVISVEDMGEYWRSRIFLFFFGTPFFVGTFFFFWRTSSDDLGNILKGRVCEEVHNEWEECVEWPELSGGVIC